MTPPDETSQPLSPAADDLAPEPRRERRKVTPDVPAADPAKAMLVVVHGADSGQQLSIGPGQTLLGRGVDASFKLSDRAVSPLHAQLTFEGNQWVVKDLGTTTGTFVNDLPVDEYALRDGDRLRVGRTILKLLASGDLPSRAEEERFRLSTVDGLTLAANRAAFDAALVREVGRSRRFGQALSLVLVDVDGFRKLNERRGESVGNVVLQQLTLRLKQTLRRQDVLARISDDAFAVVLPGAEAAEAAIVAEKLRRISEADTFAVIGGNLSVTLSAGFARLRTKEDAAMLAERAMRALVKAQRGGGNRVEDASPWVPTATKGATPGTGTRA